MSDHDKKGPDVSNVNLDENGEFELNEKDLENVAGGKSSGGTTGTVFLKCGTGGTTTVRYGCIPTAV